MKNSVSIMQPYIFPYLGYFCLAQACKTFVFYDDVNFIKRGWINRNQILLNGLPHKFTIPLTNGSQNNLICDVKMSSIVDFKKKFLTQIHHSYSKAPYFDAGLNYINSVLDQDEEFISELAISSIENFYQLLGIEKRFILSSKEFKCSKGMDKADRLICITKSLQSDEYVNAAGGIELYEKPYFQKNGINISFVEPQLIEYRQVGSKEFHAGLSIIDVIMNNSFDEIKTHIESYQLK